jgi:hypothetical protein
MKKMTPKQYIKKIYKGFIAGDYTPNEVYELMEGFSKLKNSQLKKIKGKYISNEVTAENALQEVLNLFGVSGSICKCNLKDWIEKKTDCIALISIN